MLDSCEALEAGNSICKAAEILKDNKMLTKMSDVDFIADFADDGFFDRPRLRAHRYQSAFWGFAETPRFGLRRYSSF